MENKTTIFNKHITTEPKKVIFPEAGDTLNFCKDEEAAYEEYALINKVYNDQLSEREAEYEPINEEYLTDFFRLREVEGTLCEPMYINGKRYGFVGVRFGMAKNLVSGDFYLYEME